MHAYTILCYESEYHFQEERDELIEEYVHLCWSLSSREEMIEELARARLSSPSTMNYFIIVDDLLRVVYSTTR